MQSIDASPVTPGAAADTLSRRTRAGLLDKHNRHHAHPNDEDKDPDVAAGALVFSTGRVAASGRLRAFYRFQAWFFFPLLLLEAINLRVASVRYVIAGRTRPRVREATLMGLHAVAYLAAVFLVMSPGKAVLSSQSGTGPSAMAASISSRRGTDAVAASAALP